MIEAALSRGEPDYVGPLDGIAALLRRLDTMTDHGHG
jgi:hypothetical protein